jgi:hypothetical protein
MNHRILHGLLFVSLFAAAGGDAQAITRTWPGPAPCDGSLQACINASDPNDVVDVATAGPIDESININKPMTVRAAAGYAPRFAAGRAIGGNVNAAGTWSWRVQGFTLTQGFIQMTVSGGVQANIFILDNRIEAPLSGAAQVGISKSLDSTTTLAYEIQRNQLAYDWSTFDGALRAAMQVLDRGTGSSTGLIRDNRITATGIEAHGILISTQDRSHRVAIAGNQILGGRRGSIYLRQGSLVATTGGALDALLTSNLIRAPVWNTREAYGILVDAYDGSLTVEAFHNTVVDARYGINLSTFGDAILDGEVRGNIFAHTQFEGLRRPFGLDVLDARNLYFDTDETPSTPGLSPDSIFGDPRFVFPSENPRLRPDSPAIDATTTAALLDRLGAFGVPATDADGLRRIKQQNAAVAATTLDLGAFELGDLSTVFRTPAPPNINAVVNDPAVNGFASAYPQSTQYWNPDGGAGIYNDQQQSLSYVPETARWVLRQEGLASVPAGTGFLLFAPGVGDGRFLHVNTAGNTSGSSTALNNAAINNREDVIVLATRNPGSGTIISFNEPFALNYFSGQWSIFRLDGGTMPVSGGFQVYAQPASLNAFRHVAGAGSTSFNTTFLSHPLLDGNPCARLHVSQVTDFGVENEHIIGVYYAAGATRRWGIFNQDFAAMPVGAQFHVVVDPAASNCPRDIFRDGFED